jgi:hypothetical protein
LSRRHSRLKVDECEMSLRAKPHLLLIAIVGERDSNWPVEMSARRHKASVSKFPRFVAIGVEADLQQSPSNTPNFMGSRPSY